MSVNHQFCFVMSMTIALVLGTFGWNILRTVMNWVLAPFRSKNCAMRALTAKEAEQIYLDMEAVKLAQETMNSNAEEKQTLVHI